MIQKSTRRIAALFLVSDLVATLAALLAAYALRFRAEIVPVTKGVPDAATYFRLFPLIAVLWPIVYYFYGLYSVRRNRSRHRGGVRRPRGHGTRHAPADRARDVLPRVLLLAPRPAPLLRRRRALRLRGADGHPPLPRGGVAPRVRRPARARRRGRAPRAGRHRQARRTSRGRPSRCRDAGRRSGEPGNGRTAGVPVVGATGEAAAVVERLGVDTVFLALAARRPPHDARSPEGGRPYGRRRPRRAGSPPAHHLPRRRRGPRRAAGRSPDAGAAHGVDEPRQADGGPRRIERGPRSRSRPSSRRSRWRSGAKTAARSSTASGGWAWTAGPSTS